MQKQQGTGPLSLAFAPNKPEFESWFSSLAALDKKLTSLSFPFSPLEWKQLKPTL